VGERLQAFKAAHPHSRALERPGAPEVVLAPLEKGSAATHSTEVFGPALSITEIGGTDAEAYLRAAIHFANTQLAGTLGANIVIHPATLASMGRARFDAIIAELHYGTIGINAWAGLGFLLGQAAWGAFPGHTLADVQSGMGVVHNTFLLDRTERNVVEAPFRPFPRNLLGLSFTLLPRPPWFITHRRARTLGRLLLAFQYRPSLWKLPRIVYHALRG
jgi:aldehyde dehydrogenase (NAD(P)+)